MREVTRAQRARLGIFIIISSGVLVLILAIIAGEKVFERRDAYHVRYTDVSVSGLEVGAAVKYHGVRVGRIDNLVVDPKEIETVIVTISLEHGTPIKADVEAVITGFSLTGIKQIEITGGSGEAPLLKPGSELKAGKSGFEMITGRAEAVSEKLELVLSNLALMTGGENRVRLMGLIDNTSAVLKDVHLILSDNQHKVTKTIDNLEQASGGLLALVENESLARTLANLDSTTTAIQEAEIASTIRDLRDALQQARTTFTHLDLTLLKGRHDILTSLEVLRESLDSFNEFTRLISEDPSLLLRGKRTEEVRGR